MDKKSTLFLAFIFCALLALSGQVMAAVDAAGAAALKKLVEAVLQPRLAAVALTGKGMTMEGSPEVTPKGSFYEIRLPNVAMVSPQQKMVIGTVILEATPGAAGTWQVSGALPKSLTVTDPANKPLSHISIGGHKLASTWSATLDALLDIDTSFNDIGLSTPENPQPIITIGSARIAMRPVGNDETTDFAVEKITLQGTSKEAGKPPVTVTLDKAVFQATLKNAQQEQSELSVKKSFDGLKINPLSAPIAALVPTTMNAEAALEKFPARQIREILTLTKKPEEAEAAVRAIPQLLRDKGTTLYIHNTYLRSPDMETILSGNLVAQAASVFGITGKLTLSFKGLQEVLQKLQADVTKPGGDRSQEMFYILTGLTTLAMKAKSEKAPDGSNLSSFYLEITPEGKLLLNGADLNGPEGGIMNMLKGTAGAPAPVPTPAPVAPAPVAPAPKP